MCRQTFCLGIFLLSLTLSAQVSWGQFAGSRAGAESESRDVADLPLLDRESVEGFIAIDGRAEIRVRPTGIRIVLAVTSEGQTALECQTTIEETMRELKTSWSEIGIPGQNIVEDFIAVLPLYEWNLENRGNREIGVEKRAGFRMQTNVHLAVVNDAVAAKAFTAAFKHGVTDIIAFDYWSKELDEIKVQARAQAVKAARDKSELLFAALFDEPPSLINVQEATEVHYPKSLYSSFVNAYEQDVTRPWRRDMPFIRAYRARNTYYRGLDFDGEFQSRELPMRPEISVVSTVRLYFESGADQRVKNADKPND
jgi:uncharacterized protein YggE